MSWDQQLYGFGFPGPQPPTPTRTPTSSIFPSPVFQTPIDNNNVYPGWTKFGEGGFSPYASTPSGILSVSHSPFSQPISRPTTAPITNSGQFMHHSTPHARTVVATPLSAQTNGASRQLGTSPDQSIVGQPGIQPQVGPRSTPQQPAHRIQTVFSQQTATPPQSGNETNVSSTPMQNDGGSMDLFSTPGQQTMLDFSNMADPFACSMNAPQTAPVMSSFWHAGNSMNAMTMGFSNPPNTYASAPIPRGGSADWNPQHPPLHQLTSVPQFSLSGGSHNEHVPRAQDLGSNHVLPQAGQAPTSFGFVNSAPEDPFAATASNGAIDPGMAFAYPQDFNAVHGVRQTHNIASPTRILQSQADEIPIPSVPLAQPPQLPQPTQLLRSQSTRDLSSAMAPKTFMSPIKGVKHDLRRSMSECRIPFSVRQAEGSPTANQISAQGRKSPVKQLGRSNLTPIPEIQSKSKMIFSIDINGHAFTSSSCGGSGTSGDDTPQPDMPSSRTSPTSEEGTGEDSFSRKSSISGGGLSIMSSNKKRPATEENGLSRSNSRTMVRSNSSLLLNEQSPTCPTTPSEQEVDGVGGDAKTELRRVRSNRMPVRPRARSIRQPQQQHQQHQQHQQQQQHHPVLQKAFSMSNNTSPAAPCPGGMDNMAWGGAFPASHIHLPGSTRCMCGVNQVRGFMVQCKSCEHWLHGKCIGLNQQSPPTRYVCDFCRGIPVGRGGPVQETAGSYLQQQGAPLQQPIIFYGSPLARRGFRGTDDPYG